MAETVINSPSLVVLDSAGALRGRVTTCADTFADRGRERNEQYRPACS
ncbi:MAG: hypothetical protein M3N29_09260 [Chloroflexota bacterium]|nr:hypothetical protein [Chloroflexota bacterium]